MIGYVYMITSPSGQRYVGSTRTSVVQRWREHVRHARQSRKYKCHHLTNAINCYGPDVFVVETIATVPLDRLVATEAQMIMLHRTMHPDGMNIVDPREAPGRSAATKEKIRCSVTRSWTSAGRRLASVEAASIPVIGTKLSDGTTVAFASAKEAGLTLGFNSRNIAQVCKNRRRSAGGYAWRYGP